MSVEVYRDFRPRGSIFDVFACYKVNRIDSITTISDITIFFDGEVAIDWFFDRLAEAKDNDFTVDDESFLVKYGILDDELNKVRYIEDGLDDYVYYIDEESVLNELKSGHVSVNMFKGWLDNSDENFDIIIERKRVLNSYDYSMSKQSTPRE